MVLLVREPPPDAVRTPDGQVWVSTHYAAQLARKSTKTIREWVRSRGLPAQVLPHGLTHRYVVSWPRLLEILTPVPVTTGRTKKRPGGPTVAELGLRAFDAQGN